MKGRIYRIVFYWEGQFNVFPKPRKSQIERVLKPYLFDNTKLKFIDIDVVPKTKYVFSLHAYYLWNLGAGYGLASNQQKRDVCSQVSGIDIAIFSKCIPARFSSKSPIRRHQLHQFLASNSPIFTKGSQLASLPYRQ